MAARPGCPCYIWEMYLGHPCLSMAEPPPWERAPAPDCPSSAPTHLKALGIDLLAFLVPGHPWLGVARGLTHEGGHTP